MKIDGIDLNRFSGGITVRELHKDRFSCVPTDCGVYVLVRNDVSRPRFNRVSKAGRFKNLDPSYLPSEVKAAWVPNARIVYIGKAAGAKGLKQRIRQLVDFGLGKPIGHRGGRMLWHLADHRKLQVRWWQCPRSRADRLETRLIGQFRGLHENRVFANRAK